ncbi:uncharacterized protein LOC110052220, partial [Orbicella faveolata]|uniref:uncharacterized protein LOC110052220 n=1 Tax=Orbicella faveolata TaxID=48498 RepID=UPI0009E258A1
GTGALQAITTFLEGRLGLTQKRPSYRPTGTHPSFTKICLGMKIGQLINFTVINKHANSLYSQIAEGKNPHRGNNENDCNSCDSRIGFGTGGYPDDTNTSGNVARHSSDNGDKHLKAIGYILVQ